ncbi:S8 family serine peptidase [Sinomonas halotolerans]
MEGSARTPARTRTAGQAFRALAAFAAAVVGLIPALAAGLLVPAAPAAADSIRDREYWLEEYGIEKAWDVSKGAGVKIAVIDSGVDGKHPDLKGAVAGGFDASGAGAANGQKPIGARTEHGTLVASMLAGRGHTDGRKTATGGPDGVVGVAPEAKVLAVSTWLGSPNPAGRSDQDQIPEAVRWAVDQGAKVINISLGSTQQSWPESWDAAFLYAEQRDVVIVAAAGNREGGNVQVGAPATIPGVLTVAGLDRKRKASVDSSSQGISIGVAAPAEDLVGALPGSGYAEWAGTSGAAPIVAGVAALIRSKWPELTAAQTISRIVSTAKDAGTPGHDPLYGFGVLDAEAALTAKVAPVRANPLGSIAEWIRVHRKGAPVAQVPSNGAPAAPGEGNHAVPEPAAPQAQPPATGTNPWPGVVVLGSAAAIAAILVAGALHLRRIAFAPARGRAVADADDADGPGPAGGPEPALREARPER